MDRDVKLCIKVWSLTGKLNAEQMEREGFQKTASGIASQWTLECKDEEEAKEKFLEYRRRGYECAIAATDGCTHLPFRDANVIWGAGFSDKFIKDLIRFQWDNY